MSLHDYNLANQTPASYRTDGNNLNLAIAGCNASSSGITTTFAHMLYADVSSSGWMRQRNAADSTFNYLWPLGVPGGVFTYAGSPSTNHAAKYQGQPLYDTSNNAYYVATLAGTSSQATWAQVQFSSSLNTGMPKGYIQGLVPKYATAATFTISAGGCRDDSNSADIAISTAYTVNIASAGAGGLSTSETESTSGSWYYCFAIRKSTDGTVNFILTASSSGAVMPSGYDQKRLLPFAIRNTTQANFIPWTISGWPYQPLIRYDITVSANGNAGENNVLTGGSGSTFTDITCTSYIPPLSNEGLFHACGNSPSGSNYFGASFRAKGSTSNGYYFYGMDGNASAHAGNSQFTCTLNSSQVMQYIRNEGSANINVHVLGYRVTEVN